MEQINLSINDAGNNINIQKEVINNNTSTTSSTSMIYTKESEKSHKILINKLIQKREEYNCELQPFLDKHNEKKNILEKMLYMTVEVDSLHLLLKKELNSYIFSLP